MYQYKVDIYKVKYTEEAMNAYAKEGWRVIAVSPDHHSGFVDVVYEREAPDDQAENPVPQVPEEAVCTGADTTGDEDAEKENEADDGADVQYAVRDDIWDFEGSDSEESEDN